MWRNSPKSCAVRKGTPASAATIDAAQGVIQAAGKRDNAISRVSADNSASSCMPKLYAK